MSEPVSYFWFPWCTWQYKQRFIDKKIPELRATGRYWGVKQVGWRIYVKMGRGQDGYMIDKEDLENGRNQEPTDPGT